MKIEVIQINNEEKNEFEIKYDNSLKYKAKLPFVTIEEPLNLEKIRKIKILDLNENEIYTTDYKYLENQIEEMVPLKFLITGSQKINQLLFVSKDNTIKIYYEAKGILDSRYVIELNDKKYFCYSIEDGYIRHFPIYYGAIQVAEAVKSNVVIDGKDEYFCYLRQEFETLCDGIIALLLYLDRSEYSSSYLVHKSYTLTKRYTYDKTNKFYDKDWIKNNFNDEFYVKVENDVNLIKQKLKNPLQTWKEQWDSMPLKKRKLLKFVLIFPWVMIAIVAILVGMIFLSL